MDTFWSKIGTKKSFHFQKKDLELIEKEPFDENIFKKEFGIHSFVGNKKNLDAKKALSWWCNM